MNRTGLLTRRYKKKLPNGLKLFVSPAEHIQQQLFWYGWYEKEYVLAWESIVNKGSRVIDIGANIGYYSLVAAKKGARVMAIEPVPDHFRQLQQNIVLNRLEGIRCFQQAVSDRKGTVPVYVSNADNTGMAGLSQPQNFSGKTELVQSVVLDELVQEEGWTKIDLVKIDIEGAEMLALKGMKTILSQIGPVLFLEIDNTLLHRFDNKASDIYDLLHSFGYKAYRHSGKNKLEPAPYGWEDELVIFRKS